MNLELKDDGVILLTNKWKTMKRQNFVVRKFNFRKSYIFKLSKLMTNEVPQPMPWGYSNQHAEVP